MTAVVGGDHVFARCQTFQHVVTVTIAERTEFTVCGFLPGSDANAGEWLLSIGFVPKESTADAGRFDLQV